MRQNNGHARKGPFEAMEPGVAVQRKQLCMGTRDRLPDSLLNICVVFQPGLVGKALVMFY
jgi:hypothetical protein